MDKFTFGMYRGEDVNMIIEINPKYVLWAVKNVSYFSLTKEQHNTCLRNIKSRASYFDRMERVERIYSNDYNDIDDYSADFENDMSSSFDPNY